MQNFWFKFKQPIIALAPMAGYTDSAFRQICRAYGADVVYSEMISVDALCYYNAKTIKMLNHATNEYPVVFQLFGSQPDKFKQAINIISQHFKKQTSLQHNQIGLDINFGCPAHKITKNGAGAALMNEIDTATAIMETVCQNSPYPVSLKIRTQVKQINALTFIKKINHLPWSTIMIHGRSLQQGFSGPIDYQLIKQIKQLLPEKIILANGGIDSPEQAELTLKQTQADGLGIARGCLDNPWLFQHIKNQTTLPVVNWSERKKLILQHARLFLQGNQNLIPLRKHLVRYVKGLPQASQLRQKLIGVQSLTELKNILDVYQA